jgi:hypothetical protein
LYANDGGGSKDLHRTERKAHRSGSGSGMIYDAIPYLVAAAPFAVALIAMAI